MHGDDTARLPKDDALGGHAGSLRIQPRSRRAMPATLATVDGDIVVGVRARRGVDVEATAVEAAVVGVVGVEARQMASMCGAR